MTPAELEALRQRLMLGWDDAILTRWILAAAGALVLGLTLRALRRPETSSVIGVMWAVVGLTLLAFAFWAQSIVTGIVQVPYMTRIRFVVGGISVLVLCITWESIRRTHLHERYALLWVATALVLLAAAIFPKLIGVFRALTGTQYTTAVIAVAFTFLILVAFHFSIALSASQTRQTRIAQRLAILENKLHRMERERRASAPAGRADKAREHDEAHHPG
jgi:hypothetical protein